MAIPKKPKCCSKRSTKLKVASYAKAKKAAEEAQHKHVWDPKTQTHTMPKKKAPGKKHPASKPAKPCALCNAKAKRA